MSTQQTPETGKTKVYDEDGRTVIPKDVRDAMGVGKGDELKFVYQNGRTRVVKEE